MEKLYFVAILPPEDLSRQIDEIRKTCSAEYGVFAALKPPVHITLQRPFSMDERYETHLVRWLAPAAEQSPFKVDLENFGSFNMHVVYLNVLKNDGLTSLYKAINRIINRRELSPKAFKTGNTGFNPHITIAYRDIPAETFPSMWQDFKERRFKRTFAVGSYTLLKHDGSTWQVVRRFELRQQHATLRLF